ncbi:MAG: DUF4328 domain-containing protein [Oryzihumus sp.]
MSTDSTPTVTPSGWYPDPGAPEARLRYWDGIAWTPHTHDPAAPMPMTPPRVSRLPLAPGFASLARAVRILLGLSAAVFAGSALVHACGVVLIGGWAHDPTSADLATGRLFDAATVIAGAVTMLALLGTAVTFLVWFHQAYTCDRVDGLRLREQPKWAVWGWLVPFISLVKPPRMTADLWHASEPVAPGEPVAMTSPTPRSVSAWWALWLGGLFLDRVSTQLARSEDFGRLAAAMGVSCAGDVLLLGAALLLARVVRRISDNLLLPRQA